MSEDADARPIHHDAQRNDYTINRRNMVLGGTTLAAASAIGGNSVQVAHAQQDAASVRKPNILFIMGDDIGWFLPTAHGFDEFFGNLYHLNAKEEPENLDYAKNPELRKKFGPRGVLQSYADSRIENVTETLTANPANN